MPNQDTRDVIIGVAPTDHELIGCVLDADTRQVIETGRQDLDPKPDAVDQWRGLTVRRALRRLRDRTESRGLYVVAVVTPRSGVQWSHGYDQALLEAAVHAVFKQQRPRLTLQVETVGAVEAVATASALTGVQITHRDTARAIAAANRHADRLGAAA